MSELLPCPFCGGTAEMTEYKSMSLRTIYVVSCQECEDDCGKQSHHEAEAIEKWNRRAPTIPPDVREAIRKLADYGIPLGATNHDWRRWRDAALAWLDAQDGTP